MIGNRKGGDDAGSKAQIALNQFSNYYLFGTDSTNPIQGDYAKNTGYKAVTAMEKRDAEFFNKAKEYYDAFMQAYEQDIRDTQKSPDVESIDDYLSGDIVSFTQMFDFIDRFATTPALTFEEIFGIFINAGLDPARQFVNDYYAELSDTSYELGVRYAKERTVYDLAQVDQYYMYQDSNCMDGEDIKDNCIVNTKKYDMSHIEEAARIADSDILQLPDEVVESSIEQLYLIQKGDI